MAKKRGDEGGGGDSWMNTYADMVTLLLTFFAVMLSMSNTDEQKFNAFIKSFSSLPQEVIEEITGGNNDERESIEGDVSSMSGLNDLYLSLKKYVEDNNQEGAVEISSQNDIIYVRFNSMMFFKPDEYTLLEESLPTMSFIGDGLKKYEKKIRSISVCGHTADIAGFGTSNVSEWFLSSERAATVAMYFDEDKRIEPTKIISIGYGGKRPIADNSTEAGRTKNRRVELVIVGTESKFDFNAADPTGKLSAAEDPASGKTESDKSESSKTESNSAQSEAESVSGETTSDSQSSAEVSATPSSDAGET